MFELLLTVSGVGPKVASTIIYNLGVDKISRSIRSAKPNDLKGNGVGLKTAQKIVIELAGKIGSDDSLPLTILSKDEEKKLNEIEDALIGLGYSKAEISNLNDRLVSLKDMSPEEIIKQALNYLKGKNK
jgi:Holliday junction DNA helicase RuvA